MSKFYKIASVICLTFAMVITISGCAGECVNYVDNWSVALHTSGRYTQKLEVKTYNNYYFLDYEAVENDDGTITVTAVIGQPTLSGKVN